MDDDKLSEPLLSELVEETDTPCKPTKVAVLKIPSLEDDESVEEKKKDASTGEKKRNSPVGLLSQPKKGAVLDKLFQTRRSLGDENQNESRRNPKSLLYTILNPKSLQFPAVCFRYFISNVIVVDFIFFIISTEPVLKENGAEFFEIVEGVSSTIFLIEFICRIITITETSKYGSHGAFWGRVQFLTRASTICDVCAAAPFFLQQATGWEIPTLTFLRTFRLARILKTSGFAQATDAVWRVLYYNRQIMYLSLYVGMIMILTTSVLLYYLRPQNGESKGACVLIIDPVRLFGTPQGSTSQFEPSEYTFSPGSMCRTREI
jgi:hypothetical protein